MPSAKARTVRHGSRGVTEMLSSTPSGLALYLFVRVSRYGAKAWVQAFVAVSRFACAGAWGDASSYRTMSTGHVGLRPTKLVSALGR